MPQALSSDEASPWSPTDMSGVPHEEVGRRQDLDLRLKV